jgi:hypothetical protein
MGLRLACGEPRLPARSIDRRRRDARILVPQTEPRSQLARILVSSPRRPLRFAPSASAATNGAKMAFMLAHPVTHVSSERKRLHLAFANVEAENTVGEEMMTSRHLSPGVGH